MTSPLQEPAEFISPVINRVDIAWICVATDDPSPLHLDEPFAKSVGHRSVVVPGTMLIGWFGQYFEEWAGEQKNLRDWKVRFTSPLWPDEQLKISGKTVGDSVVGTDTIREVEATAVTTDGRAVARATARFVVPDAKGNGA